MFLDYAEDQARRRPQIFLKDWQTRLDDFLRFNERAILPDAGKISRDEADRQAAREYENFADRRRALAEAKSEAEAIRHLEETAKNLPKPKKS